MGKQTNRDYSFRMGSGEVYQQKSEYERLDELLQIILTENSEMSLTEKETFWKSFELGFNLAVEDSAKKLGLKNSRRLYPIYN